MDFLFCREKMSKPIQLSWKGLPRRNVAACKTQEIALRNDLGGSVRSKDLWSRFDELLKKFR